MYLVDETVSFQARKGLTMHLILENNILLRLESNSFSFTSLQMTEEPHLKIYI